MTGSVVAAAGSAGAAAWAGLVSMVVGGSQRRSAVLGVVLSSCGHRQGLHQCYCRQGWNPRQGYCPACVVLMQGVLLCLLVCCLWDAPASLPAAVCAAGGVQGWWWSVCGEEDAALAVAVAARMASKDLSAGLAVLQRYLRKGC